MKKYQQIYHDIKRKIENGQLKKGDRLPSIRTLSQTYRCSKDTVQHALWELTYHNLIYPVAKSGYYVFEGRVQKEKPLDFSLSGYHNIAYEDFRRCINETLIGREKDLFNTYPNQQGLTELLESLQHQLEDNAVYSKIDNIIVTSGVQQALYILTQLTFPNKKSFFLLEQPTYHRMNELVHRQNLPFLTIERDFKGINWAKLEELFKTRQIKCFYTISRYSNPLGLSYSKQEKEKLVELAAQYDVYIIEDDYLGDFAHTGDLPLHYYDTADKVIYLKSFSASLFPALRLAGLVLPQPLLQRFLDYKKLIDYDTNLIMQKALSLYLDNGMFAKNLRFLKNVFQKQMQQAEENLKAVSDYSDYRIAPQSVVLKLAADINNPQRLKESKDWHFLEEYYLENSNSNYLRLAINERLSDNLKKLFSSLQTD
ncbi:GntR family transcriptional regulator [Streptococcus pantholopis]|uniref:GntR family transcriptional regulator n=2 Tax=Streptococcus pantholopis TaxID=1811193 RepID=A0A172Q7A2_9STRE|nr:GntR family transcriptional regulator [Streptococcus pantholopis]